MAMIEGEHAVPGGMEAGGEPVGGRLLRHSRTACHHHACTVAAAVVPGSAVIGAAAEADRLSLWCGEPGEAAAGCRELLHDIPSVRWTVHIAFQQLTYSQYVCMS